MQNAGDDFTVSGSTHTFTTAPDSGLTFFGTSLGQSLSLNTVADASVGSSSLKTEDFTIGGSGNTVTIPGNLTVQGTETIINTNELNVQDKTIGIGSTNAPTAASQDGAGAIIYGQTHIDILYDVDKAALGISTSVNVSGFITASNGIKIPVDNKSILMGAEDDLRIRHTGSHSEITDEGTGKLRLGSNQVVIGSPDFGETSATFADDGAVSLYFDNTKRIETASDDAGGGVIVTGKIVGTAATIGTGVTINNTGIDAGSAGIVTAGTIAAPSALTLKYGGTTSAATIDSSGRFLIGTDSGRSAGGVNAQSQVEGTSYQTSSLNLISNPGATAGGVAHLTLAKSRGSSDGSSTIVADGDYLGTIQFVGADGVDLANIAAHIQGQVDGTPGADDMPGALYFGTTADGGTAPTNRLKITSTGGFQFTNGLFDEKCNITAGKLSDNQDIDLADGMVHYFSTQESTTATPNIRINSSISLQTAMDTGDVCSVTLITTAAAGGYSANLTIDGNAVTEEWVGGSAPDSGSDDGLDIYTYTIICIGTGTGDSGFKVIANLTNATN